MFNKITNSPVIFVWFSVIVCYLEQETWSRIFTFVPCIWILSK